MVTTYERGKLERRVEGKLERRETALLLLEAKFGPLALPVRQRVESLSAEQLRQLMLHMVTGQPLEELHLD